MAKKQIPVGFDQLYYAIMTDEDTETYGTPKRLDGAISLSTSPTTNSETLYADDGAYDSVSSMGDVDVELGVAELPVEDYSALLGHSIDSNGGVDAKVTDQAPYVALGYRRRLANGKYRYVWLYKGRFRLSDEDAETKGDTPSYQTPTLNATFISRQTDGRWRYYVNDGDAGVTTAFINSFFTSVYVPGSDTTAPTVTTTPANNATAVAVSTKPKWTFDKAIQASSVTAANFTIMKGDGSIVSGSLGIDVDQKVVTFTPAANLTAATDYLMLASVGIKDLSGNALAAPSVSKFTTA